MADNTVRRRVGIARQILRHALKRKLIGENPFADIPVAVRSNPARKRYVTRGEIEAVMSAAPDDEWRLCIALARFGGLRIPSEAVGLKWGDVNWERGRITIHAPKTDHHGTGIRQIPLFPEIRPLLLTLFDDAEEGTEYVFGDRFRAPSANPGVHLRRIIRRAGLTPWPKLWTNLRASCATDLAQEYPAHVCASWLGHTETIAESFYLQTLDEHFEAASEMNWKAVQNPVQYGGETLGNDGKGKSENRGFSHEFPRIPVGATSSAGRYRT